MYSQAGGAQPGPDAGFNGQSYNAGPQPDNSSADNVQDADFEEVH
jgi:molecular chaperone DnaK